MRSIIWIMLFLAMAVPASAQSVADQTERAYRTFAGSYAQGEFLGGRFGETVFDGAAGRWARLNGPNGKTGVETYGADRERICAAGQAVAVAIDGQYGARLTSNTPSGTFVQRYTLVAGSTFAEHTDPNDYLAAIGLGPEKVGVKFDQQRAVALVLVNGLVQIYRPSPDIIVMTRDRSYPVLLARCDK